MSEPCVCDGSGVNGGGPCHWCNAGTIPRALIRVVMDPQVGNLSVETQRIVSEAYSVIRADHKRDAVGNIGLSGNIRITNSPADHKDTTEPHE